MGPVRLIVVGGMAVGVLLAGCSASGQPATTARWSSAASGEATANGAATADGGATANGAAAVSGGSAARLSVSGAHVLDPQGHDIVLRGYSWGQWGTAQAGDAAANAAQGANSVRLPLRWWGDYKTSDIDSRDPSAPGHIDPSHLAELDKDIAWATGQHLWVVLFVDSNYGQGAGGRTDNFWTDPAMKQQFVEVWQFLAKRYRDKPYIGAYELLPEPNPPGVGDAAVKEFYDSMIAAVRAVDQRTPVVVGPNKDYDLKRLTAAHTTVDKNVIYTGDYFIFDNALNRMPDIVGFEKQFDAPVWINQVGIPSGNADSQAKARSVLGALNADGVGWAWWTYRISSTNPNVHGIYYEDPSDTTRWLVKSDWLALVGSYLRPS
jgi:hypothetical protein